MPTAQLEHSWGGTPTPGCLGHTDTRHTIQGELLFFRNEVKKKKKKSLLITEQGTLLILG